MTHKAVRVAGNAIRLIKGIHAAYASTRQKPQSKKLSASEYTHQPRKSSNQKVSKVLGVGKKIFRVGSTLVGAARMAKKVYDVAKNVK